MFIDEPAVGKCRGQLALGDHEFEGCARRRQGGFAVPANRFRVEEFDAADQGVIIDVLPGFRLLRILLQIHEGSEAPVGECTVGFPERIDHQAAVGMMERDAAGRVDAAEADDYWKTRHVDS